MDQRERLGALFDTRRAVRETLAGFLARSIAAGEPRPLVLVALSGGADSLALAAAVAFETGARNDSREGSPRAGKLGAQAGLDAVRAGAIVVDHGLQEGSAGVAERAAEQARELGLDPVLVRRVVVDGSGGGGTAGGTDDGNTPGPEAAARQARYTAFESVAAETDAAAILTAHTRDDQAEQVLLALARGSGIRSIAGIPPERPLSGGTVMLRPFLTQRPEITRESTERACTAEGLEPWRDPHNEDPSYARVRVRGQVLPTLEREVGPGVAAALARTADLAREDADALDELAGTAAEALTSAADPERVILQARRLAELPTALRYRVIRIAARTAFDAHLSRDHTLAVAALVTEWHGQGPINVPGVVVSREGESLVLRAFP